MEILAALCTAGVPVWLAFVWDQIPARVPRHFDASGAPNAWGDKTSLLLLPIVGTTSYLLMTLASRYQFMINVPLQVDRESPAVQTLLRGMIIALKLSTALLFAYIEWASVQTALGKASGLGTFFLPLSLLAVILPIGWYSARLRKHRL